MEKDLNRFLFNRFFYLCLTIIGILTPFVFWFDDIHEGLVFINMVFWIALYAYESIRMESELIDKYGDDVLKRTLDAYLLSRYVGEEKYY